MSSAQPLKISGPASSGPAKPSTQDKTSSMAPAPTTMNGTGSSTLASRHGSAGTPGPNAASTTPSLNPADISSPHELTAFVETLLEQLDSKFDELSSQLLDRMNQMSNRVDALEASIQDIINGDVAATIPPIPQSPTPTGSSSSQPTKRNGI